MSVDNAKNFLEKLSQDESLQNAFHEAQIENLVNIAEESGFSVSSADLKQAFSAEAEGELPDDQADKIAGGMAIWRV